MKLSTGLASSILLATTAQACVRIYVNQNPNGDRDLTLWDQEKVSAYRIPYYGPYEDQRRWIGEGYSVLLNPNSDGRITYPNGFRGELSVQARRETALDGGQKQVEYCIWDNTDCGNYACGLP